MKYVKLFFVLPLLVASCSHDSVLPQSDDQDSFWSKPEAWYESQSPATDATIDLFYLVSTEVISATTPSGQTSYQSLLIDSDREAITAELAFAENSFGQHDMRYVAPYYHQFTFEAISLPKAQYDSVYQRVSDEVCEAFDYYMQHQNQGRPFAIVGFSQGAMLTLDLLRHMTDKQYQQLVGAYAIGYRLAADDIQHPHISPATDEEGRGVTVSFNSVLKPEALWPLVAGDAVTCINPVNWHTDATPATFTYQEQLHTVHVDAATHQLVVEVADPSEYRAWNANPVFEQMGVDPDCLHHYDLLFYCDYIHDNILRRAK